MKRIAAFSLIVITTLAFSACCQANKAEICKFKDNRKAAMSLVFVGETADFSSVIGGQMERFGWLPGTFIANPDSLRDASGNPARLTKAQLTKMASNGHEVSYNGNVPEGVSPDKVNMNWLESTVSDGGWGVSVTRQGESFPVEFLETISLNQDKIWLGTYNQVYSYIQERDNTTLKVSKKGKTITITPSCSLDSSAFSEKLSVKVGKRIVEVDPFGGPQTFDFSDPMCGAKIVFFGDSYVRNHQRPYTETWHYKVAQRHNMRYVNFGKNGNCVAFDRTDTGFGEPMTTKQKYLPKDADYIIIVAGHNDAGYISRSEEAHQQFINSMNELLTVLKKNYPKGKIGWVTPWDVNGPGFEQILKDEMEICAKHGIKILDAAHESGIQVNDMDFRGKYFQSRFDNAHLNAQGHDLLVDWGDEFIKGL